MIRPLSVDPLESKSILWRFMDFTKFVALISSKSLFFSRVDKFGDPFEGAKGLKKNKQTWDDHYIKFFRNSLKNPPDGVVFGLDDEMVERESLRLLSELNTSGLRSLEHTFVNCWHENDVESEAMWKLYTSNLSEGIAIQTTYGNLVKSLKLNKSITIKRVNYIDYNRQFVGINEPYWYKRKSFEHEREVRAVYTSYRDNLEHGKLITVDPETLILKIYVSPTAKDWFRELVSELIIKFGLDKKVYQSEMLAEPFH